MKDVTLTITGSHLYEGMEDPAAVEFMTEGKLYNRKGTIYLTYEETELTGMTGCKTRLTIEPACVRMKRRGGAVPIDTEIHFEQGKRYCGFYDTEYGPVEMEVLTNTLENDVTEDGGAVDIDYNISLKGLGESRSKINIRVRPQ